MQPRAGRVEVDFPADRAIAEQNYSTWGSPDNPLVNFTVTNVTFDPDWSSWLKSIRKDAIPKELSSSLIYIHGFGVQFSSAVAETAQLVDDLKFDGPALLFTWPSDLGLQKYSDTEHNEKISALLFGVVLTKLDAVGAPNVEGQLIAHSMGAKLSLDSLFALRNSKQGSNKPRLRTLILAAPDVSITSFQSRDLPEIGNYAKKTMILCSTNDLALRASNFFEHQSAYQNGDERLGQCSSDEIAFRNQIAAGLLRLYRFSGAAHDLFLHSYFLNNPQVMHDIETQLHD